MLFDGAAAGFWYAFAGSLIMFFPILRGQWWLFVGACVSLAIALLYVVVVLIGPDAYVSSAGQASRARLKADHGSRRL